MLDDRLSASAVAGVRAGLHVGCLRMESYLSLVE